MQEYNEIKDVIETTVCVIFSPLIFLILLAVGLAAQIWDFIGGGKNYFNIGILIFSIPFVLMVLFFAYVGIAWVFATFSTFLEIGHPLLIFTGVIVPIVGSVLLLMGLFKK